jgi:hypothetical protein
MKDKPQEQLVDGLVAGDPIDVLVGGVWLLGKAMPTPQGHLNCRNFYVKTLDGRRLIRWADKKNWRRHPTLESVEQGWSLEGHWYVIVKTGNGDLYGHRIVCTSEKQSLQIAEALKPLT